MLKISFRRNFCALLFIAAALPVPAFCAVAAPEPRSYHTLTTGNGHGFQLYDETSGRLFAFMDHPYRYLRAPKDLSTDGPESRNLLEDFALGMAKDGSTDWFSTAEPGAAGYAEETNIIKTALRSGGNRADIYYFSPFGLERNAMIALAQMPAGAAGAARFKFNLGASAPNDLMRLAFKVSPVPGQRLQKLGEAWVQTGNGGGALIYLPLADNAALKCAVSGSSAPGPAEAFSGETVCAGDEVSGEFALAAKEGWFGLLIAYVDEPAEVPAALDSLRGWLAGRGQQAILKDSLAEWAAWRKPPQVRFRSEEEAKVWRQNEAVLRMAQVREPNIRREGVLRVNNGMILASLMPGCWATGWVRDGSYATAALARMGHWKEAKASLDFFLNAEPVGKFKSYASFSDYRISLTRYYGSGEEEADHSGWPQPNIEFDDWGLFLWAAGQYVAASGDTAWLSEPARKGTVYVQGENGYRTVGVSDGTRKGTVYEALRDGVARPLEENLEPYPLPRILQRDSSIWEVHGNARHYAFSNINAIRGLLDFAALAKKAGKAADAKKYGRLAKEIRAGFESSFAAEGGLLGALERSKATDTDGAVIEALGMGVLSAPKGRLAMSTLAKMEKLRTAAGGYKRNGGDDPYDFNEWVFMDLRAASALYRVEQPKKADYFVESVTRRAAANFGLIAELYNVVAKDGPIGAYTGSIPMAGYGSGVYIMALLDRDGLVNPVGH